MRADDLKNCDSDREALDLIMDKAVELITDGLAQLDNGNAGAAVKDGFELFGGLFKVIMRDVGEIRTTLKTQKGFMSGFWKGMAIFGGIGGVLAILIVLLRVFGILG